ncbi:helix-turn-helix domain-containing protein [Dactylosporangium vinaceum]|uniref:Helix-turn-helix domain-containing protein n=1 Tax=Dactylosporangium vinaceum TaxID=53362 RepID=A0ABV5M6C5_9ACTN|nr:helix-turn-helix domain-containing protein [Dactylosporangium vinaceum]UAB97828.1 helix-turn-helix domain-containing protein [Dactylosporangium vinaceum]
MDRPTADANHQPADNPKRTHWSTRDEAPGEQFAYWRELICTAFLALTPESDLRSRFAGDVTQWPLGGLALARIASQRQTVRRTEDDIARTPVHGYYANLQVRGTSVMAQGDRTTLLHPGELGLVDTTRPFRFAFGSDFEQLSFFIPGALLPGPVPTAAAVATRAGVGAAVRLALESVPGLRRPERLAVHAAGMLAVALDPAILRPDRAVKAPRTYAAALADIEEHLGDDDLSPATTAQRLGVSVRFVHGLFAESPGSYTSTVRRLRLEKAARDLRDPALSHLRVIDIATEAGFVNVASFHRAFRRAFGQTPSQVRTHL